ncbi:hypothetical protein [Gymnodinialimonas sp.]
MPEIFAEFHPPSDSFQGGEEFFDLSDFANGDWDDLFDQLEIPSVRDMFGIDKITHDAMAARRPPEARTAWRENMANWQDPYVGLTWAESLRAAWEDWPDGGANPAYLVEQLDAFTKELRRAKTAGVSFRLIMDG